MPGQSHFPLYSEIPLLYSKIIMFSWGANSQKSAKAIGEIAFENAGRNAIADFCATPTDFIFAGARGIFPPTSRRGIFLFSKIREFCPRIFHKKNVAAPKKPHIWKARLRNRLVKKRDTLKVVGSAYNH